MKENMVWKAERAEHAPTVELGIYYESGEPEKRLFSREQKACLGQEDLLMEEVCGETGGRTVLSWKTEDTERIITLLSDRISETVSVKRGIAVLTGNYTGEQEKRLKQIVNTWIRMANAEQEMLMDRETDWNAEQSDPKDWSAFWKIREETEKSVRMEWMLSIKQEENTVFPAILLGSILAEGDGSYLGIELREAHGYTDELELELRKREDQLFLGVSFWVRRERAQEAKAVFEEVIRTASDRIAEEDLQAAKQNYLQVLEQLEDDTWNWNQKIGSAYRTEAPEGIDRAEQIQGYRAVTLEQVKALCRRL